MRGVSKLAKGWRTVVGDIVRAAMLFDASDGRTETIAMQSNRAGVIKGVNQAASEDCRGAECMMRLRGCGFVLVASRKWG